KLTLTGDVTVTGSANLNGSVSLGSATRTITVADGVLLQVSAAVSSDVSGAGLTKAGLGTLTYLGSSANSLLGTTTVNEGTLTLMRTAGTSVIQLHLTIGDGVGTDRVLVDA